MNMENPVISAFRIERHFYKNYRNLSWVLIGAAFAVSAYLLSTKGDYLGAAITLIPLTCLPLALGLSDKAVYTLGIGAHLAIAVLGQMWPFADPPSMAGPIFVLVLGLLWSLKYVPAISSGWRAGDPL